MTTHPFPFGTIPLPAQLWEKSRALFSDALRGLGGPAAIAFTLARAAQTAIARRLALFEMLLMKLLLIEAARVPVPPPVAPASSSPGRSRSGFASAESGRHAGKMPALQCTRYSEDPTDPQTWRVRFHLRAPPTQLATTPPRRIIRVDVEPTAARARAKARRLARRFEALRRVMADPRAAIAALSRRLRALGASMAHAFARRIASASPRSGGGPIFGHATVCAHDARFGLPHADSS